MSLSDATGADDGEDNDGEGYEIPFTIDYDAINGNSGERVETTSDGIRVTYDDTPPDIDELILTSNNANDPTLAKEDDILTLELVASEFLQRPTFSIAGETDITEVAGGTDAGWSGPYTKVIKLYRLPLWITLGMNVRVMNVKKPQPQLVMTLLLGMIGLYQF